MLQSYAAFSELANECFQLGDLSTCVALVEALGLFFFVFLCFVGKKRRQISDSTTLSLTPSFNICK